MNEFTVTRAYAPVYVAQCSDGHKQKVLYDYAPERQQLQPNL